MPNNINAFSSQDYQDIACQKYDYWFRVFDCRRLSNRQFFETRCISVSSIADVKNTNQNLTPTELKTFSRPFSIDFDTQQIPDGMTE